MRYGFLADDNPFNELTIFLDFDSVLEYTS